SICFAHGTDVDGLASASIIRMATAAQIILVDYGNLIEKLSTTKAADRIYICDLGLNESLAEPFLKEVERIKGFASVHYIDHHPLESELKEKLSDLGVDLDHSLEECTSVLTYLKLKDSLERGANILAAYGAVTDYMDDKPTAKKIISRYDRQFILLESALLTHALLGAGDDPAFRSRIVAELSEMKFPHEIDGVFDYAQKGLAETSRLMVEVAEKGVKSTWIAYMEATEGSTGTTANMLIGAFDVPVGIAYRLIKDEDMYEVSLRGSYDSKVDLGRIVSQVTEMIGGSGGGHKKACGARIPRQVLKDFLDLVEFQIDKASIPPHR
ncbi:MAG: DHHA1 domain-containing protein, partial [Nitrososphaerales archaeon]